MNHFWILICLCTLLVLSVPVIIFIRKERRRRQLLGKTAKTVQLKTERHKLVAESGNLLAIVEQELPESLRSPESAPRTPASPLGIILTAEARQALRKRREIADRISAIDSELEKLTGST